MNPEVFALVIIFFLSFCVGLTGCRPDTVRLEQIPVPPGAEKGVKYPEFNTEIDLATNFIVADLKEKTGKVDTVFYTLREPAEWNKIVEFYDSELKKSDFSRVSAAAPSANERTKAIHYSRSGFPNRQTIVVVLIEIKSRTDETATNREAAKYQFLMLGTDAK